MSLRRSILTASVLAVAVGIAVVLPASAIGTGSPKSSINNRPITSRMILNNTITSADIKNKSIAISDMADKSVGVPQLNTDVFAEVNKMISAKIAEIQVPKGPRAYGRVKANGTIDSTVSGNLAVRKYTTGKYCVSVSGVNDASRLAPVVTAVNDTTENFAVISLMIPCSANEFGVAVLFGGEEYDGAFNVYVP